MNETKNAMRHGAASGSGPRGAQGMAGGSLNITSSPQPGEREFKHTGLLIAIGGLRVVLNELGRLHHDINTPQDVPVEQPLRVASNFEHQDLVQTLNTSAGEVSAIAGEMTDLISRIRSDLLR